jgi:hypothetical protein
VDQTTGVRSDQTVILTAIDSAKAYPDALRRVSYLDVETRKRFKFLTNLTLPALNIARIYKARLQLNGSSNGSSSACGSRHSTAPARMR